MPKLSRQCELTGDVCELLQLGRVDLLNLGPNEQTRDSDELEPVLGDSGGDGEEPVDEVYGKVERLAVKPVHFANLGEQGLGGNSDEKV